VLSLAALACCAFDASEIERISRRSRGMPVVADAYYPAASHDCGVVVFSMSGSVFAYEPRRAGLERISVARDGGVANHPSGPSAISSGGRFVAFQSRASNLVDGDRNHHDDSFVRDRETGETTRVSVTNRGMGANGAGAPLSHPLALSADGRIAAFSSRATNLAFGDQNQKMDAFIRDRTRGKTERVSISSRSQAGDGDSFTTGMSAGGRFVVFSSDATNLVPGDVNAARDVFVRDRGTGLTTRASVSDSWRQGNGASEFGVISDNGRFVAFASEASNLVGHDTNGTRDILVRDRLRDVTLLVSATATGEPGNGPSDFPAISSSGRWIAFSSRASNLVENDTNGVADVFVYDGWRGRMTRVSVSDAGAQADGDSGQWSVAISPDGSCVAFDSDATNLVPDDRNQTLDVFVARRLRRAP
jgi:Tol biopolymer transport system component